MISYNSSLSSKGASYSVLFAYAFLSMRWGWGRIDGLREHGTCDDRKCERQNYNDFALREDRESNL